VRRAPIILAAALLAALASAGPDRIALAHVATTKGTRALLDGSAERAERAYREATQEVADFPAARLALGHIALAKGDPRTALTDYAAAKRGFEVLGPALVESERKRYEDAQRAVSRLEREARSIRKRTTKKGSEADSRRLAVLEGMIGQFRVIRPYDGEGVPGEVDYHLGNALYRLQQYEAAVEAWRSCTEKLPDFAPSFGNLAVGLTSLGRLNEAREIADEAARLGMTIHPKLAARLAVGD